jgi:hypothetical protein
LSAPARWTLRRAWREDRGVTVLRGVTPPALALVVRGVVNAAVAAAGPGTSPSSRFRTDAHMRVTGDVVAHAALDIGSLEDREVRWLFERARSDTVTAQPALIVARQGLATGTLQVGLPLAVLAYIEPLTVVVVGPISLYVGRGVPVARGGADNGCSSTGPL